MYKIIVPVRRGVSSPLHTGTKIVPCVERNVCCCLLPALITYDLMQVINAVPNTKLCAWGEKEDLGKHVL